MRARSIGAVLAVAALAIAGSPATASAGTAAWPVYGHDLANSRDGGVAGPSRSEARSLARAWRFAPQNGGFTGTPVVAQGVVVAGSSQGTVYALDRATGKRLWSRRVGRSINASAAIDGGMVLVPVADPGHPSLVALSLSDGAPLWRTVLEQERDADTYASPVVSNGTVYMGTSSLFGETSDPAVRTRGSVVALDRATGAIVWKTYTVPPGHDGGGVWSTAAVDTGLGRLFVGTGNAYHEPAAPTTDAMLALDLQTGAIVDRFQATANDVWNQTGNLLEGPDADFGASPNLLVAPSGRRLVGEGQKSGVYWTLDRATLDPVWHARTGPGTPAGGILGSTAYDGRRIYGSDTPGGEIWALRHGGLDWISLDGGPVHFGSTSVANGVVYTTDLSGLLIMRNADTGLPLGVRFLGGPSWAGVAIAGKTVVTATGVQGTSGQVVAFRPAG